MLHKKPCLFCPAIVTTARYASHPVCETCIEERQFTREARREENSERGLREATDALRRNNARDYEQYIHDLNEG